MTKALLGIIDGDIAREAPMDLDQDAPFYWLEMQEDADESGLVVNVFCATGTGGGVDPSCKVGEGGDHGRGGAEKDKGKHGHEEHSPGHAYEHSAHELHSAHETHEVAEAFGGGHEAHEAIHDIHGAHEAAHGLAAAHEVTKLDASAIVARHLYGPALRASRNLVNRVPGGRRVANTIAALHDGATKLSEDMTSKLEERYGKTTARAILATGSLVAQGVRSSVGLGGSLGKALPGQHFIGAIPLVALAETCRRLRACGPDTKVEKGLEKVGTWIHALREAVGRPFKSAEGVLSKFSLKAAYKAGRALRRVGKEFANPFNRKKLSQEDIDRIAREFVTEYLERFDDLVDSQQVQNVFCPTGAGGGVDPRCSPGGATAGGPAYKVPPVPTFLDKKFAEANEAAAKSLKDLAEGGNIGALKNSGPFSSPKVQEYQKQLVKIYDELMDEHMASLQPKSKDAWDSLNLPKETPKLSEEVKSASEHPLHTGDGLSKFLETQAQGSFTKLELKKIATLNPDGIKNGVMNLMLIPGSTGTNPNVTPLNLKRRERMKAQKEVLQKVLPEGTVVKVAKFSSAEKLGITKQYGGKQSGDYSTTYKSEVGEGDKGRLTGVPVNLHKYLPEINDNSTVTLTNSPMYNKEAHLAWKNSLTTGEQLSISQWKSNPKGIREGVATGSMAGTAKDFMSAINKGQAHQFVGYRGLHGEYAAGVVKDCEAAGIGGTWGDPAPHGMSANPYTGAHNFSHGELMLRIVSKTGVPIHKEDGYSESSKTSEAEHIGKPGTKYRIAGIYHDVWVDCEGCGSAKYINHVIDLVEI